MAARVANFRGGRKKGGLGTWAAWAGGRVVEEEKEEEKTIKIYTINSRLY